MRVGFIIFAMGHPTQIRKSAGDITWHRRSAQHVSADVFRDVFRLVPRVASRSSTGHFPKQRERLALPRFLPAKASLAMSNDDTRCSGGGGNRTRHLSTP